MLYWAFNCLVVAFVAGIYGFSEAPDSFKEASQVLFLVFLVLFLAFTIRGLTLKSRQRVLQNSRSRAMSQMDRDAHDQG